MRKYTQLSKEERVRIFEGKKQGKTIKEIAKDIRRNKSTVSRELKRNSDHIGYLYPEEAHYKTKKRKARHGYKVKRIRGFFDYLLEGLDQYWSPIEIAGRWSKKHSKKSITAEAVYAFIYSEEGKKLGLYKKLTKKKVKRGIARRQKQPKITANKTSIANRPAEVNLRLAVGHFEGDLLFNKGSMSANVLVVIDRKSRFIFLIKNDSKESKPIMEIIQKTITNAHSITFDNGTEFSEFTYLEKHGIKAYFCNPHSPWQKGSVENANSLLRQFLPFAGMPHHLINQDKLNGIAHILNNTPRKILNFLTPAEVFYNDFF
jgi:IS30 family transposase